MKKSKVLVGMSGGVDSAVSAALLVEQGYEVVGAFMKNWSGTVEGPSCAQKDLVGGEFEECTWKNEQRDAVRVAAKLGIPFLTLDFEKEYRRDVVDYMFREFENGRTPNPDVMCNKYVKFDLFIKEAHRLGCDFVATGHYARVVKSQKSKVESGDAQYRILMGVDVAKDQTYFLWAIDKSVLSNVMFPIGDMYKPDVRKYAKKHGLVVADKKDSTGICFVGDVDIQKFLSSRITDDPGNIVTIEGDVLGTHKGINFYTIGQRHGLDVGGGTPYYVVEKRPETRELVVCSNFHPSLFRDSLSADSLNWFNKPVAPFKCEARIRYRQEVQTCTIQSISEDHVEVSFDKLQRAVTPGQSIVFYVGSEMIGGGIIREAGSGRESWH